MVEIVENVLFKSLFAASEEEQRPFFSVTSPKLNLGANEMRVFSIFAVVASVAVAAPAFAQNATDFSASNDMTMGSHRNHAMMQPVGKPRHHPLGAMRHPTVGNTANQRVNGG